MVLALALALAMALVVAEIQPTLRGLVQPLETLSVCHTSERKSRDKPLSPTLCEARITRFELTFELELDLACGTREPGS